MLGSVDVVHYSSYQLLVVWLLFHLNELFLYFDLQYYFLNAHAVHIHTHTWTTFHSFNNLKEEKFKKWKLQ